MFIWPTKTIKSAFEKYMPQLAEQFLSDKYFTDDEQSFINEVYIKAEKESIYFGVMGKADNVFVIEVMAWVFLQLCQM